MALPDAHLRLSACLLPLALLVTSCRSSEAGEADVAALGDSGRRGGKVQTGRVLDYTNDPNRQMCRLYLSIMDEMNVRMDKFGDATAPLAEV